MDTRQLLLDRRALVADLRSPCTPLERATIEAQIRLIDQRLAAAPSMSDTTTLIELLTVNARMPYPMHMPLYEDVRPDAVCAVQTVAELPGMRLAEKSGALELWNAAGLLVAIVFRRGKK